MSHFDFGLPSDVPLHYEIIVSAGSLLYTFAIS